MTCGPAAGSRRPRRRARRGSPSTMRTSKPGRARPTVVATVSASSSGPVALAVPALGEPVAGDDDRERQLGVDPADQLDGDVGRAGDRHPQGGQVVVVAVGVVEQRLVERGRARQHGDPLLRDPGQHPVGVEHRLGEHGGPGGDAGEDAGLEPEHVEVRVDHQVAVAGGEAGHRHPVGGDPQGAGVGLTTPLGTPVVPEVKRMSEGSSGRAPRRGGRPRPGPRRWRGPGTRPRPRPAAGTAPGDDRGARGRAGRRRWPPSIAT